MEMFSTSLRGGKAFAAEQKIRELKTRIAKLFSQKLKMSLIKIMEMSTANMNIRPSKKYGFLLKRQKKERQKVKDLEQFTICIDQRKRTSSIYGKTDTIKKVCSKMKKTKRKPQHWRKNIRLG